MTSDQYKEAKEIERRITLAEYHLKNIADLPHFCGSYHEDPATTVACKELLTADLTQKLEKERKAFADL